MDDLLGFLNSGVITVINIIKWAAAIFFTFHIAVLGLDVMNNGKDSTDVITKVKEKIVPLAVGFFLIIGCSTIQKALEGFLDDMNTNKGSAQTGVSDISGTGVSDYFTTSKKEPKKEPKKDK